MMPTLLGPTSLEMPTALVKPTPLAKLAPLAMRLYTPDWKQTVETSRHLMVGASFIAPRTRCLVLFPANRDRRRDLVRGTK